MNELVDAGELLGALGINNSLLVANDRITTLLTEEVRDYIKRRYQAVSRLMAARTPSLSSDVAQADIIRPASRRPSSLEGPASNLSPPEKFSAAAIESPGISVRTSPIWLQGHASESPGIVQDTSAKRIQATAPTKGSAKQPKKARKRLPPTDSRHSSLMRLSHLPSTPKSRLGFSKSSSSRPDLESNSSALATELSDHRSTRPPLVAEEA